MKKYGIWLLCIALIALGIKIMFKPSHANAAQGTVIILNGPSAAGKSSIQKAFQSLMMPNLWIKVGIDNLFDAPMPDITLENIAYWQKENPIRWVETTKDASGNNVITLFTGDQGEKVAYGMNSAIADYAKAGCNVIVDYIAYKKEWIDDLRTKLNGINVCWVKVNIPLSVIEEREAARGTSPQGHARSHYDSVHWDITYNLEVDSSTESAVQIAQKIKAFLNV
jgi:chloramphenicol 3-O phosphotransferase